MKSFILSLALKSFEEYNILGWDFDFYLKVEKYHMSQAMIDLRDEKCRQKNGYF